MNGQQLDQLRQTMQSWIENFTILYLFNNVLRICNKHLLFFSLFFFSCDVLNCELAYHNHIPSVGSSWHRWDLYKEFHHQVKYNGSAVRENIMQMILFLQNFETNTDMVMSDIYSLHKCLAFHAYYIIKVHPVYQPQPRLLHPKTTKRFLKICSW